MEAVKACLEERLERVSYSKAMLEDNKQETQIVLEEISGVLAHIRMDMAKQRNLTYVINSQIQAAARLNELLVAYQKKLADCADNIPKGARKQNMLNQTDCITKEKENKKPALQEKENKGNTNPSPKFTEKNIDQVEFISIPEFETVPKYMKGRVQFSTMTSAVEELNAALQNKYSFLARTFAGMTTVSEKKKYKAFKSQENKNTNGLQFITAEDLKGVETLKSENSRRSLLTILRHLKKIREIRGPGNIVRIVAVHC